MVSFAVHRGLVVVGALALAAASASYAAHAQDDAESSDAKQQRLVDTIGEIQEGEGPFSPALIDPFTDLAVLYEQSGDYALAAAAIDRTLQLLRVNEGLFTLDQLPLLEQAIEVRVAGGDPGTAGEREKQIHKLVARHPNDVRIVPVLHKLGDRQMVELQHLLAGELPPPTCFNTACPSRSQRALFMASKARFYYARAIDVLLGQQAYTNEDLPSLEMQLVRISYFHTDDYVSGNRSLLRQVSYDVARNEPMVERVRALVRVADWDLLHSNNGMAFAAYEEAYEFLKQRDFPAESIAEIFAPDVPVMLPDFVPNPLDTGAEDATGYIDVAFAIHKFGDTRHVEVVGATANATADDKRALLALIRRNDFRPQAVGGVMAQEAPVRFRYYLHSPPPADGASESSY